MCVVAGVSALFSQSKSSEWNLKGGATSRRHTHCRNIVVNWLWLSRVLCVNSCCNIVRFWLVAYILCAYERRFGNLVCIIYTEQGMNCCHAPPAAWSDLRTIGQHIDILIAILEFTSIVLVVVWANESCKAMHHVWAPNALFSSSDGDKKVNTIFLVCLWLSRLSARYRPSLSTVNEIAAHPSIRMYWRPDCKNIMVSLYKKRHL